MHDTVIPLTNPFGKGGQIQKMQFDDILPDNDPNKQYQGQPKGIRVILTEWVIHGARKLVIARTAKNHDLASLT